MDDDHLPADDYDAPQGTGEDAEEDFARDWEVTQSEQAIAARILEERRRFEQQSDQIAQALREGMTDPYSWDWEAMHTRREAVVDEAVLESYDLAPDKTCRWSLHPEHDRCSAVARYEVSGFDDLCDMPWLSHSCEFHIVGYFEGAHIGNWCVCSGHAGHTISAIAVRRLV